MYKSISSVFVFGFLSAVSSGFAEAQNANMNLLNKTGVQDLEVVFERGLISITQMKVNDGDSIKVSFDSIIDAYEDQYEGDIRDVVLNTPSIPNIHLKMNILRCGNNCRIDVVLPKFDASKINLSAREIRDICKGGAGRTIEDLYKSYFLCRALYYRLEKDRATQTLAAYLALDGWFDAAYLLFINQRKYRNIPLFARDESVERQLKLHLNADNSFESKVNRKEGYFNGMLLNIARADLEKVQGAERSQADNPEIAKRIAQDVYVTISKNLDVYREIVSKPEQTYVDSILKRNGVASPF